jgi:hypothetical protein
MHQDIKIVLLNSSLRNCAYQLQPARRSDLKSDEAVQDYEQDCSR